MDDFLNSAHPFDKFARNDQSLLAVSGHWDGHRFGELNSMSKQDEYRDSAAQTFELAARAQVPMTNPTCWTSLRNGSTWRIAVGSRQRLRSQSIRW